MTLNQYIAHLTKFSLDNNAGDLPATLGNELSSPYLVEVSDRDIAESADYQEPGDNRFSYHRGKVVVLNAS